MSRVKSEINTTRVRCLAVLLKTKITTRAVIFIHLENNLSRRFAECFDAFGAQRLFDQTTLFHHRNFLEIRFERAVGCTQRERAIMTEGSCLAAVITLCHF